MKSKRVLTAAVAALFVTVCFVLGMFYKDKSMTTATSRNKLTKKQKLEDFNCVYNILKDNFPYFEIGKRKTGFDWLAHKNEFEKEIGKTKTDDEFYFKMNEILEPIQNAHTHIFDYSFYEYCKGMPASMTPWYDIVNNEEVKNTYENWIKSISNSRKIYIVPVSFQYVEGKYVAVGAVSNTADYYGIPEGSILTKVNGINTNEYIKTLIKKSYLLYDNSKKELKLKQLLISTDKQEKVKLSAESPAGENIEKEIITEEYAQNTNSSLMDNKNNLYTQILDKDKIAYMKIKSFGGNYISSDAAKISEFLYSIKEYPNLIIDIRSNGGGSDAYWITNIVAYLINSDMSFNNYKVFRDGEYIEPFIKSRFSVPYQKLIPVSKLPLNKNYPKEIEKGFSGFINSVHQINSSDSIGFKGKIYLLVDSGVYSAAESFSMFTKATNWATIVGTETAGDGGTIDPAFAIMPNSKLLVGFSMAMVLNPDGTANEETHTKPDIFAEQSYLDTLKSIEWRKKHADEVLSPYDTVLNKVLNLIKQPA